MSDAANWVGVKLVLLCSVVCVFSMAALWWVARSKVDEIAELENVKVTLAADIDALQKRGGRIKLNTCGGRICVAVKGDDAIWTTPDGRRWAVVR